MVASLPAEEELARLEAVARYAILDPLPETAFERLAQLAAQFFRVPVALVNIVTADSSWSKACVGVDLRRLDRQLSFCARTIEQNGVLVSLDLALDPRFTGHPLVAGPGGFRFYAGAPLQTPDGHNVGTLCVLDHAPRAEVTQVEREALVNLAALAVDELELRRARLEAEREAATRQRLVDELRRATAHAETLAAVSALADLDLDPDALVKSAVALLACVCPLDWAGLVREEEGRLGVETAWHPPGTSGEMPAPPEALRRAVKARLGRGAAWEAPTFFEGPPRASQASHGAPAEIGPTPGGVPGAVLAPLGSLGGTRYLLVAARLTPRPWSRADRDLFGVTSRTVAGALLRQEREGRMLQEARRDALTGLGNRRALDAALEEAGPPRALAVLDLDGFKGINDREGHARGDVLLRLFAGALAAELPPGGTLFRLGGDEFVLLLEGVTDAECAQAAVLEGVDAAVAASRAAGFREVGASFGVALWPGEARGAKAALRLADERMYADKRRRAGLRGG
ncbi:sensor domain-containing diguanylate cyclase [Deinococcus planocerae]|uniref:sensor domain-containing diguanylate cyclase n=1 Tax=Deinococcus planocerae TaxID=1737569 RepID=UPI000C7F2199|nr:sensor domain-containing diguanylate cyclase [Deinococcus planocerae]